MSPARPFLAACIIARDEEPNLRRCLDSLHMVDTIVVFDTGSVDSTIDIAERGGAVVVRGQWHDDFAEARNTAAAHTDAEWLLTIDADEEVLTDTSAEELRTYLGRCSDEVVAVSVVISNASGPDAAGLEHHREYKLLRHSAAQFRGRVHEYPYKIEGCVTIDLPEEVLRLRHYGYIDPYVVAAKASRNARLGALMLAEASPDNPELRSKIYLDLGRSLAAAGDPAGAHTALAHARTLAQRSSWVWAWATDMQARLALLRCLPTQCLSLADELESQTGLHPYCDWLRARALVQIDRVDEADKLLESLISQPVVDVGGHPLATQTLTEFRRTLLGSLS